MSLHSGYNVSCGCYNRDRSTKHGMAHSRLYQIWADMKRRCYNPKSKNFRWYGARGISVCKEWQDFTPFSSWAAQSGYSDSLSIDRIDAGKDYSPENCRWIPRGENTKRSAEHIIEINGISMNMSEWSLKAGMHKNWFARNIKERGKQDAIKRLKEKLGAAT